jgi:ketosteroid isomerase-like protein
MHKTTRLTTGALALTVSALLAVGAAGCGDSDDGDGNQQAGGSEQAQARAAVEGLYAAIADGDAEAVCDSLTDAGQKQVAGGGLGGKSASCADAFQKFLDAAERQGGLDLTLKAKVRKVTVKGDRGTATVSFGGNRTGAVPLAKQDGEWRIEQAGGTP